MGAGKKAVLVIISLLLIFSTIFLIIGLFMNNFLYPEIYTQGFEKAGLYKLADKNLENVPAGSFIVIPEGGSKVLIEGFLANILSYIRSDTNTLSLTLKVDKQKIMDFFVSEAEKIPVCRQNQDPFADKENPCRPAKVTPAEFVQQYLEENKIETANRDTVDLTKSYGLEEGSSGRESLDKVKSTVQTYKKAMYLLAGIVILGIILILLLTRSLKSALRWTGSIFIIAGAILLAAAIFGERIASNNLTQIQNDSITSSFVSSVVPLVFTKIRFLVYITLAIGVVLMVISFFFGKSKAKEVAPKAKSEKPRGSKTKKAAKKK